jgi:hypothetical protein
MRVQPAGQQKVLVCFQRHPAMSGLGNSEPTGVPAHVTAKRGPPQLAGPQVEQSDPEGVQYTLGGRLGVTSVGQLEVHAVHVPLWQVSLPLHVPHTPPQPFEPHCLPVQFGVHAA